MLDYNSRHTVSVVTHIPDTGERQRVNVTEIVLQMVVSIVEGHGETLSTVQGILVGMVNQRQNILLFLSSVKILDHCLRFSIL